MISAEYAAGFFDGEGSVYAASRNKGFNNPTVIVSIPNTHQGVLEAFRARWGGSICKRDARERQRAIYQWVLAPKNGVRFLREVHPHLVVKREVAGVAIELCEILSSPVKERMDYSQLRPSKTPGKMTRAGIMKPEVREKISALHKKIQALNVRGAPWNAKRQHHSPV